MIKDKVKQIKSRKLSATDNIKNFLDKIKFEDKKIKAVLHLNPEALNQAKIIDEKIKNKEKTGKLAGIGVIIKSNINCKGLICNCASHTLENYTATYNATVIKKLLAEDAIILGMANMDEFACGASGETSIFGPTLNPKNHSLVPGGSSSGSAASVAANFCDFALGSDTGGSIRNPASHCGVIGFKPSYGSVSRFGLIDMCMSFDQIGPLTNYIEDTELVYDIIKGKDINDASSIDLEKINDKEIKNTLKKLKIGIINLDADEEIWQVVEKKAEIVSEKNKYSMKKIDFKYLDLGIQTYYPIVYVEFFSGTRKFDGRKYGKKIEDSCSEEVLRRIIGGREITKAEYKGKYYRRALSTKKLIQKEFNEAFKKHDVLIMPTVPKLPHKVGEDITVQDMYNYDALTVLANIAEIPSISIPAGTIDNVPVGLQILTKHGHDDLLLNVAKTFE